MQRINRRRTWRLTQESDSDMSRVTIHRKDGLLLHDFTVLAKHVASLIDLYRSRYPDASIKQVAYAPGTGRA
jgi:hypothetical protein